MARGAIMGCLESYEMKLENILADPPLLHRTGGGEAVSWQFSDEVLCFIEENVGYDSNTLETGAGLSTVLFAILRTQHICIVPDEELVDRIRKYCASHDIALDQVRFEIDPSEKALPALEDCPKLDLVLIDGCHAFPLPFLDWFYTARHLKVGGILIVDDIQLWTGHTLRKFLRCEPEWEWISDLSCQTSVFRKSRKLPHPKWWGQQPFVLGKSRSLMWLGKMMLMWKLILTGRWRELVRRVGNKSS
jgi:hypothetical protein